MSRTDIERWTLDKICAMMGLDEKPDSGMDLIDGIGFSSFDLMELVLSAEEKFGIRISAASLRRLMTPDDLVSVVAEQLESGSGSGN